MSKLPLATLIPFFLFRHVELAPNWVLAANLVVLPLSALLGLWLMTVKGNWGLVLPALVLLVSPVLTSTIFDVPLLMCVSVVVLRSLLWPDGLSLWLRGR